jgi:hypothetical protein
MSTKVKFVIGGASIAFVIAGLAMATPMIGAWYNVILSTGTANCDVVHAHVALPGRRRLAQNLKMRSLKLYSGGKVLPVVHRLAYTPRNLAQFGGGPVPLIGTTRSAQSTFTTLETPDRGRSSTMSPIAAPLMRLLGHVRVAKVSTSGQINARRALPRSD